MEGVINIWRAISACGTQYEFQEQFNRKIILGNRIAALAGVIVFFISFLYWQQPPQFFTYLSGSILCFLFIFFNYLGRIEFARIFFTLSVPVFVVVGSSFMPASFKAAQKMALISSITIPLVLFGVTEKKLLIGGLAWTILCFIAFDYIDVSSLAEPGVNNAMVNFKVIEYLGAFVSFSIFISTFIYLQKLNISAEGKLKALLLKTNQQKDEIELQKKKLEVINRELSIRALSAGLNPHFLYNSLNSVQHFLTINDKTSSLNYLSKFGRLIRQFLDYSDKGVIPLSDELTLLKYYLELESLRFGSMFQYDFEIEEELLLYNIDVPLLLIQIHVENAILHGLMNKQGTRYLKVSFRKQDEIMLCTVEDNGIGREASARIRKAKGDEHRSHGIAISTQRLDLMHPSKMHGSLINIIDLYDEKQCPAGTRVEIKIPFETI